MNNKTKVSKPPNADAVTAAAEDEHSREAEKTMTVQSGMVFKARRDCHIGKFYAKGKIVPFAPGQKAPLWLVELVSEAPAQKAESDPPDTGQPDGVEDHEHAEEQGLAADGSFQA